MLAHNSSCTQVLDHGQIEPTFIGWDLGDITYPGLIWLFKTELAFEQIWSNRITMIGIRGGFVGFLPRGMDVQPFHQPVDTPTGTRNRLLHHVIQPVQP